MVQQKPLDIINKMCYNGYNESEVHKMKNYREFINVSIFLNNELVASVDGDHIKFCTDGRVFLYRGAIIVSHFTSVAWNNAKLANKWTAEYAGEVINHFGYWVEF